MKCLKCLEVKETAGNVRECVICTGDGTANEIPRGLGDDTSLEEVLKSKPGIGARFVPEETAVAAAERGAAAPAQASIAPAQPPDAAPRVPAPRAEGGTAQGAEAAAEGEEAGRGQEEGRAQE